MEFVKYGSTSRLFRPVVITEKIDGSNCVLGIEEDSNQIFAGSRTKWLSKDSDHFGFWVWAQENRESLIADLGPGLHRGEWFGQKMQRKYGLDHREFALFNTDKWGNVEFVTPNLRSVPVLHEGVFDQTEIDRSLELLAQHGSVAAPGFMRPEGICVFHTAANLVFKVLLENDDISKAEAGLK